MQSESYFFEWLQTNEGNNGEQKDFLLSPLLYSVSLYRMFKVASVDTTVF